MSKSSRGLDIAGIFNWHANFEVMQDPRGATAHRECYPPHPHSIMYFFLLLLLFLPHSAQPVGSFALNGKWFIFANTLSSFADNSQVRTGRTRREPLWHDGKHSRRDEDVVMPLQLQTFFPNPVKMSYFILLV